MEIWNVGMLPQHYTSSQSQKHLPVDTLCELRADQPGGVS
jgi:hypothetical protein